MVPDANLWQVLFDTSPDVILVLDADGRLVAINKACQHIVDSLGAEGFVGSLWVEQWPPEARKTVSDALQAAKGGATGRFQEFCAVTGKWLDVSVASASGLDGAIRLLAICRDVSEMRRVEAELRESKTQLQLGLAVAGLALSRVDYKENVFHLSAEMARMLGLGQGPMTVPRADIHAMLHPDDAPAFMGAFQRALDPDGPGWFERDVRVVKPSCDIRWYRARQQVIFEGEGAERRPSNAIIVAFDVTDEKEAGERQKESDRNKDEFLATLAHELRNPLAPLRSGLEFLADATPGDPAILRIQGIMERQVTHLVRLVDDLLDISRISRGKIQLKKEEIDAAAIARQAIADLHARMEAKDLAIAVSGLDAPLPIVGDPVRVAQILVNLLDNAIKFTDGGGAIRVGAECSGGEIRIEVSDTGIGVSSPMLPRIFDLFSQDEAAREHGRAGLGIGLALVQKLVLLHGGSVEARSPGEGRGASFLVSLPLSAASSIGAAATETTPPTQASARRALIVDDNHDAADSLALALQRLELQVEVAYSGAEALAHAAASGADLVLLDLGMPAMDGYETARRLRAQPGGAALEIVALTGWGEEETRRRTKDAGFDGHLVKPARIEDIAEMLARPAPERTADRPRISNGAKMA